MFLSLFFHVEFFPQAGQFIIKIISILHNIYTLQQLLVCTTFSSMDRSIYRFGIDFVSIDFFD